MAGPIWQQYNAMEINRNPIYPGNSRTDMNFTCVYMYACMSVCVGKDNMRYERNDSCGGTKEGIPIVKRFLRL